MASMPSGMVSLSVAIVYRMETTFFSALSTKSCPSSIVSKCVFPSATSYCLQSRNRTKAEPSSIFSTVAGIRSVLRLTHIWNALAPISLSPSFSFMLVMYSQYSKAPFPNFSTVEGKVTSVTAVRHAGHLISVTISLL